MNQTDQNPPAPGESAPRPVWPAWPHWWPVLLGPVTVAVIYLYDPQGQQKLFSRHWQDDLYVPYILTLAAFAAALVRAVGGRNPLMGLLAAMALAIYYRELHWTLSSVLAYTTLVTTVLMGQKWYQSIGPYLCRGRVAQWLVMTAASYVFAVAIAKGWFQWIVPNDDILRDRYEETCENVAHLMLLFTALATGYRRSAGGKSAPK